MPQLMSMESLDPRPLSDLNREALSVLERKKPPHLEAQLTEQLVGQRNSPDLAALGLMNDQRAGLDVGRPYARRLPPPNSGEDQKPRDESVWLLDRADTLDFIIAEPIRRALLNLRQDSSGEWRSLNETGVLAPIQDTAQIREHVLDRLR